MNPVSIDLIAVITAGTSVIATIIIIIIQYYQQKMKDAEERGKLLNRVDQAAAEQPERRILLAALPTFG
jgi:hypothetical protein